jgi:hypothetical protein
MELMAASDAEMNLILHTELFVWTTISAYYLMPHQLQRWITFVQRFDIFSAKNAVWCVDFDNNHESLAAVSCFRT